MNEMRQQLLNLLAARARRHWTLDDALALIREIAPTLKSVGFYPALTGSVLYPLLKGTPPKDLDLIIYPHNNAAYFTDQAREALRQHGLTMRLSFPEVQRLRRDRGTVQTPEDRKVVEMWHYKGRRIDVIYLT